MQGLLPKEQILDQVNASCQKIDGVLLLTNVRLLWKRTGDALFQVNENRLNVSCAQNMEAKDSNRFVLKVDITGKKSLFFSFSGSDAKVKVERVTALLNTRVSAQQARELSLSEESMEKLQVLGNTHHLKDLFDELVVKKQSITEQEFWGSTLSSSDKRLDNFKTAHDLTQAGISNRPFLLIPRQNVVTQKTEFSLEQ